LEYADDLLSDENGASSCCLNDALLKRYVYEVIPAVCEGGDDEQHGSSVLADVNVLQALSKVRLDEGGGLEQRDSSIPPFHTEHFSSSLRSSPFCARFAHALSSTHRFAPPHKYSQRIHYGKFVAESKYRSDPEGYQKLVDNNDVEGVMRLLTNDLVEKKVLKRAKMKCATYGREPLVDAMADTGGGEEEVTMIVAAAAAAAAMAAVETMEVGGKPNNLKLQPAVVEAIYRDLIIPLTKEIEIEYLFKRCGRESPCRKSQIWNL